MSTSAVPGPTAGPDMKSVERATLSKVRRRLLPIIAVLYFIAFLDRNNVGFAKLTMGPDVGLTEAAFGFGAGVFFIGYALFEVPSNAGMVHFGARKWIARIMISWGIVSTAMIFTTGPTSFAVLRFLLGVAEAGFFPAMIFYLTLWFPQKVRVTVLGTFILAQPISNAIGAPLSGAILAMPEFLGVQDWQWLFIIEGVPAIVLGVLVPRLLTDRPEEASWLSETERGWLTSTIAHENSLVAQTGHGRFLDGLKDSRVWAYAMLNFGMVCGIYGFGLWLPTVIKSLGQFSTIQVGLISVIPYGAAAIFLYLWARNSDRTGLRAAHAAASMVLAAVGLVAAGLAAGSSPVLALFFLTIAAMGSTRPLRRCWRCPPRSSSGRPQRPASAWSTRSATSAGSSPRMPSA
ncbi:MFS transporter [Enemella evansiae]|uniref:MFS transporter n=1 Tax=Enemella evansiae TaxID=2016499 RepID=UPI001E58FFFC|nr:MFS transporter [Enemella evansiae]